MPFGIFGTIVASQISLNKKNSESTAHKLGGKGSEREATTLGESPLSKAKPEASPSLLLHSKQMASLESTKQEQNK